MRLLFLCSGLEPGRDGVGDYVQTLAAECARQGHVCAIIALHDHHIIETVESADTIDAGKVESIRLPTCVPWSERIELAMAYRSRFQPDWISFQFVAYGYADNGITFQLNAAFQRLTAGCPFHFMFHELWIGVARGSTLRHRLVGAVQRLGIKRMIFSLQPSLVTTSNPVYIALLQSIGTRATLLPLFGNVPLTPIAFPASLPIAVTEAGLNSSERAAWWVGLFFGALHPEWKPEPLLGLLLRAAQQTCRRICLVHAGHAGASGNILWKNLQQEYGDRIVFVKTGEQTPEELSTLLQVADFGITASPWQLIGKSGTTAAMLDHGLPVIVSRDDFQPRIHPADIPSQDPLLHRCDETLEAKLAASLPKRPAHARLGEVTEKWLTQLKVST